MKYNTFLLNSLDTVFYDSEIKSDTLKYSTVLANEAFSFQLAVKPEKSSYEETTEALELRVEITGEASDKLFVYSVENIPGIRVGYANSDDWFLRKTPGLYPDWIQKRGNGKITFNVGRTKSLWFNFNEKREKIPSGKYSFKISLYEFKGNIPLAEKEVEIEVLKTALPEQRVKATNWIHYDCISHFSNTEPFSNAFFDVAEKYIRLAIKNCQNMILVPAFTPPLDTPEGEERATVQLVGVEKKQDRFEFDFSLLKRFLEMCKRCGEECGTVYFEHSHLFTQWGAKHAPKIIVSENGEKQKMFGWHTDASSKEYRDFLHEYLSALKIFIKQNGYEKNFFFHVSDEPSVEHFESYKSAADFVHEELAGFPCGDALCDYEYYEKGLVNIPIASNHKINDFVGRTKELWVYYTGFQSYNDLSNRLVGMPSERTRVLGAQMYYHDIDGFLHWGFNAHHNRLSRKIGDPRIIIDMDGDFVTGTSYLVYPNITDVDASLRLFTFRDQMQDENAFELLESLTSKEIVKSVIKKHIPNISFNCRISQSALLELRNDVNMMIKSLELNN